MREATRFHIVRDLSRAAALLLFWLVPGFCQLVADHWTTNDGLPLGGVSGICQSPEGYLWMSTYDGFVRFDGVRFTTFNRSNTAGMGGNRLARVVCTASGDVWAGSEGSGVTRYHQG